MELVAVGGDVRREMLVLPAIPSFNSVITGHSIFSERTFGMAPLTHSQGEEPCILIVIYE
jgi:hypothetical protein